MFDFLDLCCCGHSILRSCKGGSGFGVQVQEFRVKVLGVGCWVQGLGSGFTVEKNTFRLKPSSFDEAQSKK